MTDWNYIYAYERKDKPKEPGFSHEWISSDFKYYKHMTNEDKLEIWTHPQL